MRLTKPLMVRDTCGRSKASVGDALPGVRALGKRGSMSSYYFLLIPTAPDYVPDAATRERARGFVVEIARLRRRI
jgi:hypothetical protein